MEVSGQLHVPTTSGEWEWRQETATTSHESWQHTFKFITAIVCSSERGYHTCMYTNFRAAYLVSVRRYQSSLPQEEIAFIIQQHIFTYLRANTEFLICPPAKNGEVYIVHLLKRTSRRAFLQNIERS
jgi:hypothetical protein